MDSAGLARRLRLTPMAVRQHLYALQREKMVSAEERPVPIGRPAKYWRLTRSADQLFSGRVRRIERRADRRGRKDVRRRGAAARARVARRAAARGLRGADHTVGAAEGAAAAARARCVLKKGTWRRSRPTRTAAFSSSRTTVPSAAAATACQGFCSTRARSLPRGARPGRHGRAHGAHRLRRSPVRVRGEAEVPLKAAGRFTDPGSASH